MLRYKIYLCILPFLMIITITHPLKGLFLFRIKVISKKYKRMDRRNYPTNLFDGIISLIHLVYLLFQVHKERRTHQYAYH